MISPPPLAPCSTRAPLHPETRRPASSEARRLESGHRHGEGRASHALSIRLSPLTIRCCLDDRVSLETWWQNEKCLAIWRE